VFSLALAILLTIPTWGPGWCSQANTSRHIRWAQAVHDSCPPEPSAVTPPLTNPQLDAIRKRSRPPGPLVMHHGDLRSRFLTKGQLVGVLIRQPDGSIIHRHDNDKTLHPAEVNPVAVRHDNDENVHWWDQSLFDNLDQGWPHPRAHHNTPLLMIQPYATSLYASYWNFERAIDKTLDKSIFPSFMLPPCGAELPCLPYIVADRAMIARHKVATGSYSTIGSHTLRSEYSHLDKRGFGCIISVGL